MGEIRGFGITLVAFEHGRLFSLSRSSHSVPSSPYIFTRALSTPLLVTIYSSASSTHFPVICLIILAVPPDPTFRSISTFEALLVEIKPQNTEIRRSYRQKYKPRQSSSYIHTQQERACVRVASASIGAITRFRRASR